MAISAGKKASIKARAEKARREQNIRTIAITNSLHSPFYECNWDREARNYLATGVVIAGGHLESSFRYKGVTA
jgi:hypothetical protein